MSTVIVSPEFEAAQNFLHSGFAQQLIAHLGESGEEFGDAVTRAIDFFPSIDRGEYIPSEITDFLGVYYYAGDPSSVYEILEPQDDGEGFSYAENGALFRALQSGINTGSPSGVVDYCFSLAELYYTMKYVNPEHLGHSRFDALCQVVDCIYYELGLDVGVARTAFWEQLGMTIDHRGYPTAWWS